MTCPASLPSILGNFRYWEGSRDADGYREYKLVTRVQVDHTASSNDGPANALNTPGLPLPGTPWIVASDVDLYATCTWQANIKPVIQDGERSEFFDVEQIFSSRPSKKCVNRAGTGVGTGNVADDPLSEPPIITIQFVKYTTEATLDRLSQRITNSAHERIRGPLVEFDATRLTIRIQVNEASLDLTTTLAIIDMVNSVSLWGFDARTVKLSNVEIEQWFTATCDCYYTKIYEFEVSPIGFDRTVLDEGTKALNGKWNTTSGAWELIDINGSAPDVNNPSHFIRVYDLLGNPMRVVLNGAGVPATNISGTGATDPGEIAIEYYEEIDFLLNFPNIPSSLDCVSS